MFVRYLLIIFLIFLGCNSEGRIPLKIISGENGTTRHKFSVELAQTGSQRMLGLMYREKLGSNRGMLFLFPQLVDGPFWMKNTLIPLDILFIGADKKIISMVENAEPLSTTPRAPAGPYQYVLEIEGGRARELGIQAGDRVEFELQ